jgi:5S rRNA maturation endonuclease (ribonuclease M5)
VNADDFVRHLDARGLAPRKTSAGWQAKCSAHDDTNASLTVSAGNDGRILLHCHAGCSTEAVVGAIGLAMADLFAAKPQAPIKPKIVATYDYTDEAGVLIYQSVRYVPKDFRVRRPDPTGITKYVWNIAAASQVRRVLYRLPEVVAAIAARRMVFVVEGEKDADTLAANGCCATCNVGGAGKGKWLPEYNESLRGAARVVVIADRDEPGRVHARAIANAVYGVAKTVRLLELPDVNGKPVKDASDFFAAGGTVEELQRSVNGAPNYVRPKLGNNGIAAEYLPSESEATDAESDEEEPTSTAEAWPEPLDEAAFHGLAGEVVRTIEPHSEGDPAAIMVMFLSAFGNLIGASAHFEAEARQHPGRFWPVLVGATSKGRKGSAWSGVRHILRCVDEPWLTKCTGSGLSSGEGLIFAVRDPVVRLKKAASGSVEEVVEDGGVQDKRLLVIEEEFSAVLKVCAREGNTLSDLLRRAWDGDVLRTMTRRSPLRATGTHVSVVGHVTQAELHRLLATTDCLNGFGNRFVWVAVRRSKLLPEGGRLLDENLAPLVLRLRKALDFARTAGLLRRADAARERWADAYPILTRERGGVFGAITGRAEAQVMRMALLYALLDCSPQIDVQHLEAALAVWDFCDRSAAFIFGESLGDTTADKILDALRTADDGLTRSAVHQLFGGNLRAPEMDRALGTLERLKLAQWTKEPGRGVGRPAVVWRAVQSSNETPANAQPQAVVEPEPQPAEVEL